MEDILCYRIQWLLQKMTSYNICLHLNSISVTNGMVSTPPWAINSDQAYVHLQFDTTYICQLTATARCNALVTYPNIYLISNLIYENVLNSF